MALSQQEITEIVADAENLREAFTRTGISDQLANERVNAAMPVIVTANTGITRYGPQPDPS